MLGENQPFITLDKPCAEAINWLVAQLRRAGLTPVRTFDLQVARQAQVACPCPYHGTAECDCQMVVLLIYEAKAQPLALVAHGYNGETRFSVVDTPQQRANPRIEAQIRRIVDPQRPIAVDVNSKAHAA